MSATGKGRLTILLHAGMHKTGTTSIQRALSEAELRMKDGLCGYLRMDSTNFSGAYVTLFRLDAIEHMSNWLHGRTASDVAARKAYLTHLFATRMTAATEDTAKTALLISAEALSSPMDREALSRFRDVLLPWAREIQVQAYVRAPISFMESHFLQRLKGVSKGALDPSVLWPRYRDRFERLDQVFGANAVHLARYDPARFPNGDVVQDVLHRLGIKATAMDLTAPRRENRGLMLETAALLYTMRRSAQFDRKNPDTMLCSRALASAMSPFGSRRLRFAPALVEPVLASGSDDLRWMEKRLGAPIADAGTGDGIRGAADLLAIAAASRDLLNQIDDTTLPALQGMPLTLQRLHNLLDEGLAA